MLERWLPEMDGLNMTNDAMCGAAAPSEDLILAASQVNAYLNRTGAPSLQGVALAVHAGAAAEPVAWWRVSYIDREGNSDADVQIGKNKPTPQLLADNGFPWEPLYGSPLVALTSAPTEPDDPAIPINRSLLAAACQELRKYALPGGADDQVVLNIEAAIGLTPPAETPQAAGAIDAREQDGVQWLPWQAITEDVLSEHERFLVDGGVKQAAFFPVDANRLANIALHCIREVRAARIALAPREEAVAPESRIKINGLIAEIRAAKTMARRDFLFEEIIRAWESRPEAPPAAGAAQAALWRDMATAPKDGTLLRLLVEFEHHATEDAEGPQITIGSNTWDNHHDFDEWQFAGWNWEQDCYTQGIGKPVGWLPMLDVAPASTPETSEPDDAPLETGEGDAR